MSNLYGKQCWTWNAVLYLPKMPRGYSFSEVSSLFFNDTAATIDDGNFLAHRQYGSLPRPLPQTKLLISSTLHLATANVFTGGLSQGCAMSLHFLLSYEDSPPLRGFVGMSGWLPFADGESIDEWEGMFDVPHQLRYPSPS